ncbi:MAG TPA: RagB/SusD family nutrient uptake outer membrane protein [Puia sp.]|nr:RagB/SusD family nutrient uptake outer membrane protein [Puia sp.]
MTKILYSTIIVLILLAGAGIISSCKKNFLDKKPSTNLVVPSSLEDFQALLDNDNVMRETPELGELSTDDYYLPNVFWQGLDAKEQNAYIWAKDLYGGQGNVDDWNLPYQQVFYANVVLEGLPKLTADSGGDAQGWKALKGAALFIRAYAFYNLAQVFAPVFDKNISAADDKLGIPLRLHSDINLVSVRSTVKDTYAQILSDLNAASGLLPVAIPTANRNRPSKPAALAMLARVYLSMGNYGQAGIYADSCLNFYNKLIDYNILSPLSPFPFSRTNLETMYQSRLLTSSQVLVALAVPDCIVDSILYRSYAANDLRSTVFYTTNPVTGLSNIKGSYNGQLYPFSGLATDEVYLIRAECAARAGNIPSALNDLDTLLVNRWKKGSFVPVTASDGAAALDSVLLERRKELAFRGVRWTDLRRLNKEGAGDTLIRKLNGQTYQLLPNGPRYVLSIPPDVLRLSGIPDNP